MPSNRRAPVKVVVCQWLCGTGARQRSPRFARPRRRAILVEAPVSSTNTRRSGSRSGCASNHASRRAATSDLLCSLACAVFWKVMPWRSRKRQIVLGAKLAPCPRLSRSASSANVMSTCASIAPRMTSPCASMRCERRSPPLGFAAVAPVSRHARSQRTAVATATPKRAAAALRDSPPSTAAITRTRRSSDKVFAMQAGPLASSHGERMARPVCKLC